MKFNRISICSDLNDTQENLRKELDEKVKLLKEFCVVNEGQSVSVLTMDSYTRPIHELSEKLRRLQRNTAIIHMSTGDYLDLTLADYKELFGE